MFGIGFFELLVIAVVALVFVGPAKLPELMKQAGKFFVYMRRTASEVRSTVDNVVREAEAEIREKEFNEIKKLVATDADEDHKAASPDHSDDCELDPHASEEMTAEDLNQPHENEYHENKHTEQPAHDSRETAGGDACDSKDIDSKDIDSKREAQ